MGKYTFGTGGEAAARLKLMADFFNPPAEMLIRTFLPARSETAVDLGCGPGFTTAMLSRASGAAVACGLDNSEEFLDMARSSFPNLRFIRHDVARTPFPSRADVMYVRFVLSHLPSPVDLVRAWLTQVNPGGILVIEETEAVEAEVHVFRDYLSASEALVASGGARLFVGSELAAGDYGVPALLNACSVISVPDRLAAAWFLPNARTIWPGSEVMRALLTQAKINEITVSLEELIRLENDESRITWKIRRIVLPSA